MQVEHNLFKDEFPEYRQKITELKNNNTEFADLYHEYIDTDNEIIQMEKGSEAHSADDIENLRKKRMMLKVRLFWLINQE